MKGFLLELNSIPSLNIFLQKTKLSGESIKELSEIDKYVKTVVVEDAIKLSIKKDKVELMSY